MLEPDARDLLEAISRALDGPVDRWRVAAVASAVGRVLDGVDDPGTAADWLWGFLIQHKEAADGR